MENQLLKIHKVPIGLINLSIAGAPLETFIGVDALKSDSSDLQLKQLNHG
jgi:hypothetical protein